VALSGGPSTSLGIVMDTLPWQLPWRAVVSEAERAALQQQLAREIWTRPLHPLWGERAVVIGRRIDNDDVLVRLRKGSLACVHLEFNRRVHFNVFERFFPHTIKFERMEDFVAQMTEDARDHDA
jgi:hypothetical protein